MTAPSRRRFLGLSAAVAGLALLPLPLCAAATADADATPLVWRGSALGADAVIQLHCRDAAAGRALIAACVLAFLWQQTLPPGLAEQALYALGVVPAVLVAGFTSTVRIAVASTAGTPAPETEIVPDPPVASLVTLIVPP